MADKTPNYSLKKPAPTDFYNVEDQNENMDQLDAALKELSDSKAASLHAAQHTAQGSDPVTPAAIGAANKSHTHPAGDVQGGVIAEAVLPEYLQKANLLDDTTVGHIWGGTPPEDPTVNLALRDVSTMRYTVLEHYLRENIYISEGSLRSFAAATDGGGNTWFFSSGGALTAHKWSPDGSLSIISTTATFVARSAATDGNGNVLVVSAILSNSSGPVYKFDPSGTYTTLTNLSQSRGHLAAATDGNGSVLFGGGYNGSAYSNYIDRFDVTGTRTTLSLSVGRAYLAAATDGNGNVLFGGGWSNVAGGASAVVDRYDVSGTRTTLTPLSQARSNLIAATDGNGNVLFAGGGVNVTTDTNYTTVDRYDTSGTRTVSTPLSQARRNLGAATLGNGDVLFGGGNTSSTVGYSNIVERYDMSGNMTVMEPLIDKADACIAVTDANGSVLFTGAGMAINGFVDRYSRACIIPTIYGAKYRFEEHTTEQTATSDEIIVNAPNTGYIRFGGTVTI